MTIFMISAFHSVVTMAGLSLKTKSRIQKPIRILFHAVLWVTQILIRAKYTAKNIKKTFKWVTQLAMLLSKQLMKSWGSATK